jgi:recombination protein RecR
LNQFAEPMSRLIEELRKLPGVGSKSAQRLAFHILRATHEDAGALADAISTLKATLHLCSVCNNITDVDPCAYCTAASRNQRLICVVEEPTSIAAIEKSRQFNGVYHVLHGTLSPLNGVGPDELRIANLLSRVQTGGAEIEVILATSPTLEGEATASYVAEQLHRLKPGPSVTRIATGVPAGSDIEYADEVTISRALEGRRKL